MLHVNNALFTLSDSERKERCHSTEDCVLLRTTLADLEGAPGTRPPGPICFISLQFSGKIDQKNRLGFAPPSGKSWIRHCTMHIIPGKRATGWLLFISRTRRVVRRKLRRKQKLQRHNINGYHNAKGDWGCWIKAVVVTYIIRWILFTTSKKMPWKLLAVSGCALYMNFLTLHSMILMQSNARCSQVPVVTELLVWGTQWNLCFIRN